MYQKYQNARFIFVVGIGGSDLASKAVWNALTLHRPNTEKKIFFLESPDSREYQEIENFVKDEATNLEEIVLITISKSGGTIETLTAFHKIFDILSEKFGQSIKDRVLVISTEKTPLWELAKKKEIECLDWEDNVSGRFSAFTIAHTVVLFIAGLNTDAFIAGSKEVENGLASDLAKNIFSCYEKGVNILDFFIFNSELEDLGKWCRQLIAESLGKKNKEGQRVGITPTVFIGPTDLHSMLQLALGGPQNRFTLFIRSLEEIDGNINESAYENTVKTYKETGLPFEKYEMPKISEKELGKFMAYIMTVTVELAKLLEVNPYDQPEVENYKKSLHNL